MNEKSHFPTSYHAVLTKMRSVNPERFGSRDQDMKAVITGLSPYISRGVISTKMVMDDILARGFTWSESESFMKELARRDYAQQVWKYRSDRIYNAASRAQEDVESHNFPSAVFFEKTGIEAIDYSLKHFFATGYMHNYMRMYIASLICNVGHYHWSEAARWFYYYSIDGDWGSNSLSWQWICGSGSKEKYFANQSEINSFFQTDQLGTFLDCSCEDLRKIETPAILKREMLLDLKTTLPENDKRVRINANLPTFVYNYYNLDPDWHKDEYGNRILLLEPSLFQKYPIGKKAMNFALDLGSNIDGLQVANFEFSYLKAMCGGDPIIYKEHPLNEHYVGKCEPRDWMFSGVEASDSFEHFWGAYCQSAREEGYC